MHAFSRSRIIFPLVSALAVFALSARAEEPAQHPVSGGAVQGAKPPPGSAVQAVKPVPGHPPGPVAGRGPQDTHRGSPAAHVARGALPTHNFGGHAYRGRLAWEGGRWHHEVHDGRDGWWWDVGGIWYYYPQPMEGPPTYISEDYADDIGPYGPPVADGYAPPPPGAYAPPPPDPAGSAVGGAIVGGLLGGLLTGHASGAAAGAIAGGATGAIVGAEAASRPGYYLAQGNCYYRYPSGQYVQADPRACY
jgi:hypothetical protein